MDNFNPVDQTFIAARVPTDLKERIKQFSTMNDISVSQIIRKGIKKILEESGAPSPVGGWSVRQ